MSFDITPLGDLLGEKGYIRGPFGSALKRAELKNSGIPVYEQQHAIRGDRDFRYYIDEKKYKKLKRFTIETSDLIISCSGTVGRISIIDKDDPKGIISQALLILRPNTEKISSLFLYYFLTSKKGFNELINASQGAVQLNIAPRAVVEKIPVPTPSSEVQQRIVYILRSLDDKIALNRQINQTLEAMAQAIFKSWFVDFDPVKAKITAFEACEDAKGVTCAAMRAISGKTDEELDQLQAEQPEHYAQLKTTAELFPVAMQDSELGEVPEGWTLSSVGAEFNATMGQSPPGNTYNENGEGKPFFQGRRDFGWRYPENRVYCTQPKRMAKKGDTLLSVRAPVGDVNKAITDCCIGRGVAALRHKLGCEAYTYYSMMDLSRSFKSFDSEGTVFGSINQKDLKSLKVVKPSNIIIEAFTHTTEVIDQQILNLDDQIRVLAKLRDTLLPKFLSGELSVDAAKLAEEN
ncbi:MAG: restriction endonuclease subunit S [Methanosarcinales archaeon]|nr:restriction endonuclease subunit S [Methanosarcinales archaeon]